MLGVGLNPAWGANFYYQKVNIMNEFLVANIIITPDGTKLQSFNRHDYKGHTDANGEYYFIDGGLSYIRSSLNKIPAKYINVFTTDPHEVIREHFHWGTYGKDGDQPLTYLPLCSLETGHIEAILETQTHLEKHITKIFLDELKFRA